jgi:hypothetical protein
VSHGDCAHRWADAVSERVGEHAEARRAWYCADAEARGVISDRSGYGRGVIGPPGGDAGGVDGRGHGLAAVGGHPASLVDEAAGWGIRRPAASALVTGQWTRCSRLSRQHQAIPGSSPSSVSRPSGSAEADIARVAAGRVRWHESRACVFSPGRLRRRPRAHDRRSFRGRERGQYLGPGDGAAGKPLCDRNGMVRWDRDDSASPVCVVLLPPQDAAARQVTDHEAASCGRRRRALWFWPPVGPQAKQLRVTVSTLWEAARALVDIPGANGVVQSPATGP